jgi:hypothetical protein
MCMAVHPALLGRKKICLFSENLVSVISDFPALLFSGHSLLGQQFYNDTGPPTCLPLQTGIPETDAEQKLPEGQGCEPHRLAVDIVARIDFTKVEGGNFRVPPEPVRQPEP